VEDRLPQRVPAEPDVPALPEPVTEEAGVRAEAPELARIATYLRHDDPRRRVPPGTRDSFDVKAVLAAVQEVSGVRGAELRHNPGGVHTLRLDLADGADPAMVSRAVARLLNERMGLAAAPSAAAPSAAAPSAAAPSAAAPSAAAAPSDDRRAVRSAAGAGPAVGAAPSTPPLPMTPEHSRADTTHQPRRRYAGTAVRGRASVEARPPADDLGLSDTVGWATAAGSATSTGSHAAQPVPGTSRTAHQDRPSRPLPARADGVRVVLDHVQVLTFGLDATVEVRLALGDRQALGEATGPAVDAYVLRLAAVSAASAIDQLLVDEATSHSRGRCFVEHAAVLPLGSCEVAVAVVLLVFGGWVEQLAGSALVAGDPRQAVVRATLSAVNRRLESLLS
jgi:hypothetical protein